MSKTITITFADDQHDSFKAAYLTTGAMADVKTGRAYPTLGEAFTGEFVRGISRWFVGPVPTSSATIAQTALLSATIDLTAAINPTLPTAIEFTITSTTPASFAHGTTTTHTCTVTLALTPNPSWAGTVTFSAQCLSYDTSSPPVPFNITATFSPTTRTTAGNTTATVQVDASVPAGAYDFILIGTDGNGDSNGARVVITVT